MSTHDRAVDHGIFVVRIGGQSLEYPLPHTSFGPTREAGVSAQYNNMPVEEALLYQQFFEALEKAMFPTAHQVD